MSFVTDDPQVSDAFGHGTHVAGIIAGDPAPANGVTPTGTVTIFDGTKNEEMEYQLVTSEESDVVAGKISTTSPIGRALLNKKVGDTAMVVTPGGSREMEILKLSTIHDLAETKLAELQAEPERETE